MLSENPCHHQRPLQNFQVQHHHHSSQPRHCRLTNNPPSTNSCAPLTYPLNSLHARKTAGPAISLGSPVRPNGIRFSIYAFFSSLARSSSFNCVLIVPGNSALHLILYFPS